MRPSPTFTATPHGILINGLPLTKSFSENLSAHALRYIKCAEELLKQATREDWNDRTPHSADNVPIVARVQMLLALASPQPFGKSNPYHLGPGPKGGQFTTAALDGNSEGITSDRNKAERTHDFYVERKQNFVDAHLIATEKVAQELNMPVENILGIAALESEWGEYRFASKGNNFFGIYYPAPYGVPNEWNTAHDNPNARLAVFDSYEDSLKSFAYSNGSLIQGKSDPVEFMQGLQDSGKFGINTVTGDPMPTYVHDAAATIRGLRSIIAQSRAKSGNK
jgi:hypothetical protein